MMAMEDDLAVRAAGTEDLEAVLHFYNDLIKDMQAADNPPRWEKDIYPSANDLSAAITEQSLFPAEKGRDITGAFVMNHTGCRVSNCQMVLSRG